MVRNPSGLLGASFLLVLVTLFRPIDIHAHAGDSDPNMIHACVQQSSKQVRIVGISGACTNAETPVHWAIAGPAGPTGPTGPAGAPGADGKPGEDGAPGAAGTPAMLSFAIVSALPDVRLNNGQATNTWFVLTKRVLDFHKVSGASKLRITYQDTLGTKAAVHNACHWRIVVDTTVHAFFSDGDYEGPYGWRMHNGTHTAWVFDIPAGPHQLRVEALRTPSATDCLSGWNNTGNFLSVEEIP